MVLGDVEEKSTKYMERLIELGEDISDGDEDDRDDDDKDDDDNGNGQEKASSDRKP